MSSVLLVSPPVATASRALLCAADVLYVGAAHQCLSTATRPPPLTSSAQRHRAGHVQHNACSPACESTTHGQTQHGARVQMHHALRTARAPIVGRSNAWRPRGSASRTSSAAPRTTEGRSSRDAAVSKALRRARARPRPAPTCSARSATATGATARRRTASPWPSSSPVEGRRCANCGPWRRAPTTRVQMMRTRSARTGPGRRTSPVPRSRWGCRR